MRQPPVLGGGGGGAALPRLPHCSFTRVSPCARPAFPAPSPIPAGSLTLPPAPSSPPAPRGEELKLFPRLSEVGVEPEARALASDSSEPQTLADGVTAGLWEMQRRCGSSLSLCPSGFPGSFCHWSQELSVSLADTQRRQDRVPSGMWWVRWPEPLGQVPAHRQPSSWAGAHAQRAAAPLDVPRVPTVFWAASASASHLRLWISPSVSFLKWPFVIFCSLCLVFH